jgi:hypothetical protein
VIAEDLDLRVWAALRPIEAVTRRPIVAPMRVLGEGQVWMRNRIGLLVLHELHLPALRREQFAAYERSFEAPTAVTPAVNVVTTLEDPRGVLLSRRVHIALPRATTAPPGVLPPLFEPIDVPLYPASHAALAAPWAVVRAHVSHGGEPAAGCVLTVHEPGDEARVLGRGQSDERGEAVVAVTGVPAFIPSAGPEAFVRERTAEMTVVFEVGASAAPDTDQLAAASGAGFVRRTVAMVIASGRETSLTINLP